MRTVISHFYNEEYLLPWWLDHHKKYFDYGIMINHNSNDKSVDIIRDIVPQWRIVNTSLTNFNAYMTDFEVMSYERNIPGWKIALNTTEFLVTSVDLNQIQKFIIDQGKMGATFSGYNLVDNEPNKELTYDKPLVKQAYWGFSDNLNIEPSKRLEMNLGTTFPSRNRFFHCNEVGMYHPGRHLSFHPDSQTRLTDVMIFHYCYSLWNEKTIHRKLGLKDRLDPEDIKRGWGAQHLKKIDELESCRNIALTYSDSLKKDPFIDKALSIL